MDDLSLGIEETYYMLSQWMSKYEKKLHNNRKKLYWKIISPLEAASMMFWSMPKSNIQTINNQMYFIFRVL